MELDVIVIGAGMTGLAAAYYLRKRGLRYAVLEAKSDVGGVWHAHRWPGARCDSDFIKYSFSFKPYLSEQCLHSAGTIQRYLRAVAEEFRLLEHIRFDTRVVRADFDRATGRWTVQTDKDSLGARFVINGNGYFSDRPHVPRFPDQEKFRGEVIHAAALEAERPFAGKRVAVIGSGSTAICCAPALADAGALVTLVQRSPSYIYETDNRAGGLVRCCQRLHQAGFPAAVRWLRAYLQLRDDLIFVAFRRLPRFARWFFHRHWKEAVGESALREHFTPRYNPWEQRIPVAIGLKEALRSGRVTMKTGEIARFIPEGIELRNGEQVPCDLCVLATGLELEFFKLDLFVGGARVDPLRINFYRGLMVGGIPNYFHPMGSWHSAWTQRCEPVLRLAVRIIEHMRSRGLRVVAVERKDLPIRPGITPNYVLRALDALPRMEGTTDLPSVDNLFATRFYPARLQFS